MAQFYADRIALGSHRARTPEGFLVCLGIPFARTGIQEYRESEIMQGGNPDKVVKIIRTSEEVFNPATLASFEGKPITYRHPPQFVTPDNWNTYAKGHAQNIRMGPKLSDGEQSLVGDLVITDSSLIPKIESNLVSELSAGYNTEYVPDPHTDNVYRQTKIRGNHIAVVPNGRAGNAVKILDSEEGDVPEPAVAQDDKVSLSTLKTFVDWVRTLGKATDAPESESVKKNEEVNKEALERAKARNKDSAEDKEEEGMPDKEKEKAEKEKEGKFKEATDSLINAANTLARVADALDKKYGQDDDDDDDKKMKDKKAKDRHKSHDEGEEEEEKKKPFQKKEEDNEEEEKEEKKEHSEDADLIAVETQSPEDRPKNPIPGADKALDALRALRPFIAKSNDKALKIKFNDAILAVKSGGTADYASLLDPRKPEDVVNGESKSKVLAFGAHDSKANDDFVSQARKYHRRNVGEAAAQIRTAGKE